MRLANSLASARSSSPSPPQLEVLQQLALVPAVPLPLVLPRELALVSPSRRDYVCSLTGSGGSASGDSTATETGAAASSTSDSDNGAGRNTIAGAGLLGLVIAGLAL